MCQSMEQGGKRCAAHTRPRFTALMEAMETAGAKNPFNKADGRKKARNTFTVNTDDGNENALNVVANHASTPTGAKEVAKAITDMRGERDMQTVAFLTSAAKVGTDRAEAAKETTTLIKKAVEAAKRKETGSRVELNRNTKVMEGLSPSLAEVFPGIAARWDLDHPENKGILPSEVAPNTNGSIWLRCEQGHSWDGGRGNNINAPIKAGKRYYPICPECEGRRPRLFSRTQTELATLTDALGDDPDAFNALPPALQYALLNHMGVLRGSDDSMSRQVGMSIVHGDLSLKDVMAATDPSSLDGSLREDLDDEQGLKAVSNVDVLDTETSTVDIDQVLASAGVLALVDADSDLATSIMRANNEVLWDRAYDNEATLDDYAAFLNNRRGGTPQGDAAIDRFTAELEAVRNFTLPEGYTTERLNKFGDPVTMDPDLSQRRFALLVAENRRFMNWSTTGAGKTLSTTLAIQSAEARETLVVCPNAVTDEWKTEFAAGFPTATEVIVLDNLADINKPRPDAPEGVNRVWVANYEKFSGEPRDIAKTLAPLTERVDAIVYDEIHKAKSGSSNEDEASKRRRAMVKFTDKAGENNPNLIVVGASATPVVNNLEEAKSVLRLVEGPTSKSFPTAPTIKNAAGAHHRLAGAGVRRVMKYPTSLTREDVTIDVSSQVHRIQGRINKMRTQADNTNKRVDGAMMERALLPEKMPALIKIANRRKANNEGPTVVYTHYTTGMVNPMRTKLEAEGLRVATYTGTETQAERSATLKAFRNGDYDVLIGSRPISTGVDGLQHISNEMVVVSMPDHAADDDQTVGRLDRRGQSRDVKVSYLLTEANAGGMRWSYCKDTKQRRVKFKRDIANAAVDGVLPDGSWDTEQHSAEKALGDLKSMTTKLAQQNLATA